MNEAFSPNSVASHPGGTSVVAPYVAARAPSPMNRHPCAMNGAKNVAGDACVENFPAARYDGGVACTSPGTYVAAAMALT